MIGIGLPAAGQQTDRDRPEQDQDGDDVGARRVALSGCCDAGDQATVMFPLAMRAHLGGDIVDAESSGGRVSDHARDERAADGGGVRRLRLVRARGDDEPMPRRVSITPARSSSAQTRRRCWR
jgi:hypothetical protein